MLSALICVWHIDSRPWCWQAFATTPVDFFAVKLQLVTSKVMIAFKLFFEESLQGPPLVTDFVAKVF